MKSYLRFLSRNKLYTAIEVVGLSVALAFVIVLGSYIIDDMTVGKGARVRPSRAGGSRPAIISSV